MWKHLLSISAHRLGVGWEMHAQELGTSEKPDIQSSCPGKACSQQQQQKHFRLQTQCDETLVPIRDERRKRPPRADPIDAENQGTKASVQLCNKVSVVVIASATIYTVVPNHAPACTYLQKSAHKGCARIGQCRHKSLATASKLMYGVGVQEIKQSTAPK